MLLVLVSELIVIILILLEEKENFSKTSIFIFLIFLLQYIYDVYISYLNF